MAGFRCLLWLLPLFVTPPVQGRVLVRVLPRPAGDEILIARVGSRGTLIERWQVSPWRRRATRPLPRRITDLVPRRTDIIAVSAHRLHLVPADLAHPQPARRVWETRRTILRVVPFGARFLALASEGLRDGHHRGGLVYLLTPRERGPWSARALSLLPRYNFWEMQVGDVEGDGSPEIALCTWSKTLRIPTYARRYFIYGWNGRDVFPRWRGSRLSKPYVQTHLIPLGAAPGSQLLSVEATRGGRRCLVAYRWNDFGFTGLAQSAEYRTIEIVDSTPHHPLVRVTRSDGRHEICAVSVREDRLLLRRIGRLPPDALAVAGRFRAGGNPQVLVLRGKDAGNPHLLRMPPE